MSKWTTQYNCHSRRVGRFMIECEWDTTNGSGYRVRFGEHALKKRFKDAEEGKRAGEQLARDLLKEALAELRDTRRRLPPVPKAKPPKPPKLPPKPKPGVDAAIKSLESESDGTE